MGKGNEDPVFVQLSFLPTQHFSPSCHILLAFGVFPGEQHTLVCTQWPSVGCLVLIINDSFMYQSVFWREKT